MSKAVHQNIKHAIEYFTTYRNNLVNYLMSGVSEKHDNDIVCERAMLQYEKDHVLREIKDVNFFVEHLHNYNEYVMLMIESGSVIKSINEWMLQNKIAPDPEQLKKHEKLNDVKAGLACLYDNVSTDNADHRYRNAVFKFIDDKANINKLHVKDRFFTYNRKFGEWNGSDKYENKLPFVKLSDVMHFKSLAI